MYYSLNKKLVVCTDKDRIIIYNLDTDKTYEITKPVLDFVKYLSISKTKDEIISYCEKKKIEIYIITEFEKEKVIKKTKRKINTNPFNSSTVKKETNKNKNKFPSKITLYLSNTCNLNCIHCAVNGGTKAPMELNTKEWLSVVEQAKKIKFDLFQISGGEPLTIKDRLTEILLSVKGNFEYIVVNTNGILVNNEIAKFFKEIEAIIYVSVYGDNKQIYKKITNRDLFNEAEKGIRILVKNNVDVRASVPLINPIIKRLPEVENYIKNLGIERVAFMGLIPQGRAKENLKMLAGSWKNYLPILHEYCAKSEAMLERNHDNIIDIPCHHYNIRLNINSQGSVYPCEFLPIYMGNARSEKLKDIINKKQSQFVFNDLSVDQIAHCKDCSLRYMCKAVCPSFSYSCTGDYNTPPATCLEAIKNYYKKINKDNFFST